MATVRRLSLDAAKATIRDRNGKVTDYSPAQLRVMANAFVGPWLIVQAKARIAARTVNTLLQSVDSPAASSEVSQ
jgi:hypothetical protein